MTKADLLKLLETFGNEEEVFIIVPCSGTCYSIEGALRVYENPSRDCDRGTLGASPENRIAYDQEDWKPVVGIEVGY